MKASVEHLREKVAFTEHHACHLLGSVALSGAERVGVTREQ
jgi:predicted NodU family carbamoyl transferase